MNKGSRTLRYTLLTSTALLLLAGCDDEAVGSAQPAVTSPPSVSTTVPAPSTTSSSPPPTTSSSTPASSSTPSGVAHSKEGAAQVLTEFLHAMGAKDTATTCRIAAPTMANKGGDKECQSRFKLLFSGIPASDLAAAKAATVDPAKLKASGADKVTSSGRVSTPPVPFFEQFGELVLEWRGNTWLVTS